MFPLTEVGLKWSIRSTIVLGYLEVLRFEPFFEHFLAWWSSREGAASRSPALASLPWLSSGPSCLLEGKVLLLPESTGISFGITGPLCSSQGAGQDWCSTSSQTACDPWDLEIKSRKSACKVAVPVSPHQPICVGFRCCLLAFFTYLLKDWSVIVCACGWVCTCMYMSAGALRD